MSFETMETAISKLRNDFNEECDNIKELSDRIEAVEDTIGAHTDAVGSFRLEIEQIKEEFVTNYKNIQRRVNEIEIRVNRATHAQHEIVTRIQALEDRHSKHSHVSQSHSHLGVEEELQRLNKCVDDLNDNLQALKEKVFGADEGHHSSFFRELLELRGRVASVEILARHSVTELDLMKIGEAVRIVKPR